MKSCECHLNCLFGKVVSCSNSKVDLTSSYALQMDENGTSLETGPQGSGIPGTGDFSVDVIDFLAK